MGAWQGRVWMQRRIHWNSLGLPRTSQLEQHRLPQCRVRIVRRRIEHNRMVQQEVLSVEDQASLIGEISMDAFQCFFGPIFLVIDGVNDKV